MCAQKTLGALVVVAVCATCGAPSTRQERTTPEPSTTDEREVHLAEVTRLTTDGHSSSPQFSFLASEIVFASRKQSPQKCTQVFRAAVAAPGQHMRMSTGTGEARSASFFPGDRRVVFSSNHLGENDCPRPGDSAAGAIALYAGSDIFSARPDGTELRRLSNAPGYDGEPTVCSRNGSIVFTSSRGGDLDLYRMDADGANVKRLTHEVGYDGDARFSPDCKQIAWRASRPRGKKAIAEYKRLLKQGLVRPSATEIMVVNDDGKEVRQITYLGAQSAAPAFHPTGKRVLFASDFADPGGAANLWAVDVSGTRLERITYSTESTEAPVFSSDGSQLAFAAARDGQGQGSDVYVAKWIDAAPHISPQAADRFLADVAWLAADARQGRGVGSLGLQSAADWITRRFRSLGLQGGLAGGEFLQSFEVTVGVASRDTTMLTLDGRRAAEQEFSAVGHSAQGNVTAPVVFVGFGITAKDVGYDDYKGKNVTGKIALAKRFAPGTGRFGSRNRKRRYSDLHYKAWNARAHGATALLVADLQPASDEAPLPPLRVEAIGMSAIPVVVIKRELAQKLIRGRHRARIRVDLEHSKKSTHNVVAKLPAGAKNKLPGVLVIGAHYDHLGFGAHSSLAPGSAAAHNGADDNASGIAALIEIARRLQAEQETLARDVYFVAFSAEERGLVGSTYFVSSLPPGVTPKDMVAMLNMDMVGRLRRNKLSVLGGRSAKEWSEIVDPVCDALRVVCSLRGGGYGPSDQTPFYAAGVPVLHFFTGAHPQYHRPTDDTELINAIGGARVAAVVGDVAKELVGRESLLTYENASPLPRAGDARSVGASLGSVPDYTAPGPGVLLTGVRRASAAEQAGLKRGDRILRIGTHDLASVRDLMFVLRQSKPGQTTDIVVERAGKRVKSKVTFGKSRRRQ